MTVEWRDIPGYEGLYQASSGGRVRSLDRVTYGRNKSTRTVRGRTLGLRVNPRSGYVQSVISVGGKVSYLYNHRLVCLAFNGEPADDSMEVCHGDGDKQNNRPENLRWGTREENMADKKLHGTHRPKRKLDRNRAEAVRVMAKSGLSSPTIAGVFGVTASNISMVLSGRTWGEDR